MRRRDKFPPPRAKYQGLISDLGSLGSRIYDAVSIFFFQIPMVIELEAGWGWPALLWPFGNAMGGVSAVSPLPFRGEGARNLDPGFHMVGYAIPRMEERKSMPVSFGRGVESEDERCLY